MSTPTFQDGIDDNAGVESVAGDTDGADDVDMQGDEDVPQEVESLLVPHDASPEYAHVWHALGEPRVNVIELCGGTLQGMVDMFNQLYDNVMAASPAQSIVESYQRSCRLFGVLPDTVVSLDHLNVVQLSTMKRTLALHLAIEEQLRMQTMLLEQTQVAEILRDRGSAGSDELLMDLRSKCMQILHVIESAHDIVCKMLVNHAAQTGMRVQSQTRFPRSAFFLADMEDTTRELKPSQVVEIKLYKELFARGCRRVDYMVMAPHFVMKRGRSFNTFAFRPLRSIEGFVEHETSISKNFGAWRDRGPTKFIVENLKSADTYMFPPLIVVQGVFSCQDCVMNFREGWFYFYDAEDPMVVALEHRRDAAVAVLESAIQLHIAMMGVRQRRRSMIESALPQLVAATHRNDTDEQSRLLLAVQVQDKSLAVESAALEGKMEALFAQVDEAAADGDTHGNGVGEVQGDSSSGGEGSDVVAEADGARRSKHDAEGEAEEGEGEGEGDNDEDEDMLRDEFDMRAELEMCERCIEEHRSCIQRMRTSQESLGAMLRTTMPDSTLVAEMFIDMPFPWTEFSRMFTPVTRQEVDAETGIAYSHGWLEIDWRRIRTPSWQYLYEYQRLPPDAIDFAAYVMYGRMIFPPKLFDFWQVVYEEIGWSNTGKSVKAGAIESIHRETNKVRNPFASGGGGSGGGGGGYGTDGAANGVTEIASVSRTGILSNNIESPFGPAVVIGINPEQRNFAVVHRDMTRKFGVNFPSGEFLVWAANEENTWPVKNKNPLVAMAPHTALFGNIPLPHEDTNDNMNRRRITVRNNIAVKRSDPRLEKRIRNIERLALLIKSAFAYTTFAREKAGQGIWNEGVLPKYFHTQRQLNRMANQPLVAFLHACNRETILLDQTANQRRDEATGQMVLVAPEQRVRTFMSMKRLQSLINDFTARSKRIRSVDWTNQSAVTHALESYGCEIIIPADCPPDSLPDGMRPTSRGKWVVGLCELAQPQSGNNQQRGGEHRTGATGAGAGAGAGYATMPTLASMGSRTERVVFWPSRRPRATTLFAIDNSLFRVALKHTRFSLEKGKDVTTKRSFHVVASTFWAATKIARRETRKLEGKVEIVTVTKDTFTTVLWPVQKAAGGGFALFPICQQRQLRTNSLFQCYIQAHSEDKMHRMVVLVCAPSFQEASARTAAFVEQVLAREGEASIEKLNNIRASDVWGLEGVPVEEASEDEDEDENEEGDDSGDENGDDHGGDDEDDGQGGDNNDEGDAGDEERKDNHEGDMVPQNVEVQLDDADGWLHSDGEGEAQQDFAENDAAADSTMGVVDGEPV